MTRYQLEPLLALMGCTLSQAQQTLGIGGPEYRKYRDEGMGREVAERKALKAGFHPYECWPQMVEDDIEVITRTCAARGCEETFIVNVGPGANRLYCSRRCAKREAQRRYYASRPDVAESKRESVRRYYAETAEYQRRQRQARYRRNADEERRKRRERYRQRLEEDVRDYVMKRSA